MAYLHQPAPTCTQFRALGRAAARGRSQRQAGVREGRGKRPRSAGCGWRPGRGGARPRRHGAPSTPACQRRGGARQARRGELKNVPVAAGQGGWWCGCIVCRVCVVACSLSGSKGGCRMGPFSRLRILLCPCVDFIDLRRVCRPRLLPDDLHGGTCWAQHIRVSNCNSCEHAA